MKRRANKRLTNIQRWRRMRPKRSRSGPKAEDATPKLARKAWCGMIRHCARGHDSPTMSTLEARAGPHVKCSGHRSG
eukprot:364337-Chlamydomonas_euryale.AAC.1